MILLIILFGYLLPVFLCWYHYHLAFSKGGRWEGVDPNIVNLIIMLIPGVNIINVGITWLIFPPNELFWGDGLSKLFRVKR